jgi:hypothetical protein
MVDEDKDIWETDVTGKPYKVSIGKKDIDNIKEMDAHLKKKKVVQTSLDGFPSVDANQKVPTIQTNLDPLKTWQKEYTQPSVVEFSKQTAIATKRELSIDDFPVRKEAPQPEPEKKTFLGTVKDWAEQKRQSAEDYVKTKQEVRVQAARQKRYTTNIFIRDEKGNWQYYTTVDDTSEKSIGTGKFTKDGKEIPRRVKELEYITRELDRQHIPWKSMKGEVARNLKELQQSMSYTGRLTKKFKEGAKQTIKEIPQTAESITSGIYEKTNPEYVEDAKPTMTVSAWGSQRQPVDIAYQYPVYRDYQAPKPTKRTFLAHSEFQALLTQGFTKEQLSENGIEDKQSPYFQEKSVFSGCVPYRPIGYGQSFIRANPPKTEYQKRIAAGLPYQAFRPLMANPMVLGQPDPITGQRQTSIRPVFAQSKNFSFPYVFKPDELTGARTWFKPVPVSSVTFSPMKQEITYDESGNVIRVRKTFFKPPMSRL